MLLIVGLSGACRTTTPESRPGPDALEAVDWAAVHEESTELLQRLLRVDNSNPPGLEAKTARILERYLARDGIETHLVELAPGRSSLYARIRGTESEAKPIVLLSHLDSLGAETGNWPSDTGPFSGAIHEGFVYGRGALSGKALAVVHASAFVLLARASERPRRDLILVATADGTRTARGIDQLLIARPEILDAELVLGWGGMGIQDLFGDGRVVHAVATSEKGFVDLVLTSREDPPGEGSMSATERLNRALINIRERKSIARLTSPMELTLDAFASYLPFPRDVAMRSRIFAQVFELGSLKKGALTRGMVTDSVRVSDFVAEGPAGLAPSRATARLRAELLSDTDPARLKQELRLVVDDPRIHFNIVRGEAATLSPVSPRLLEVVEHHVSGSDGSRAVVVPFQSPWPSDLRVLRRHGISAYGFVPFEVSIEEYEAQVGRNERLSLDNLSIGVKRMVGIVRDLAVAPPTDHE